MPDLYIGLISGTSADGVDAVLLEVSGESVRILHSLCEPYALPLRQRVLELARSPALSVENLGQTDVVLGRFFASAALKLISAAGIEKNDVRAIGSHGQTIRHCPSAELPFTMQIGDPNQIAAITGITTVADFRRRDMALGGQGAPLVPAFHEAAFGASSETRTVVNLGGIANVTVLAAGRATAGFDTGPGNCLLDQHISAERGASFDSEGAWSAQGSPDNELLVQFMRDPYFEKMPPKSSGPEYFNLAWVAAHQRQCGTSVQGAALQASLAELTARSVGSAIKAHAPSSQLVLLCGGGAHNADLVKRLGKSLPGVQVSSTALLGVDPDFVEAAAFAWLACQSLHGRPGNVPAATGASATAVLGAMYPA
ncbi:MAG: anhydro-N-acetylmuramic acid kinase [Gammaproteobacteria bacterium]|nr:anhydro-N-acetylmuramic acid kinase [Gammaproteobacteria bacterium]